MSGQYYITGTGTGVGKTLTTAALCRQYTRKGYAVAAYKPVISGFDVADAENDAAVLLRALGKAPTAEAIRAIAPWRFCAPLSPQMAAWSEGGAPALAELAAFCRQAARAEGITLVEGVGGIMSPLNEAHTQLDLMLALRWKVVLVGGTYLGGISHLLTAMRVLPPELLHAVVLCESAQGNVGVAETARAIQPFAPEGVRVYTVPRLPRAQDAWKDAPPLIEPIA